MQWSARTGIVRGDDASNRMIARARYYPEFASLLNVFVASKSKI